ncbi:MAG: radical SAM protein [Desulfobacterales bacterium]|nr:radical SAM protein [Pseudomonadota bacterium]MBU4357180.1 radical SAM protein [Pseudomonadota bacterium]MCG2771381.1 radical SAM protein [Desulfobacterales bacterium]
MEFPALTKPMERNQPYISLKRFPASIPRIPLEGNLDLTYRCNNNCRHCWLRISPKAKERKSELSFEEIKRVVNEARKMGCQKWNISGGEPMLRPDFPEIFGYITSKSVSYSLNTNGTLINPEIAHLLKRKGNKMVALYGATADVHDHITRNPGSFEATMQGFAYLKEAGAGFTVQLIPMRSNYHQFDAMVELAQSLSSHYRIGAAWLYLSACGSRRRNAEIARQRLDPRVVIELDKPDLSYEEWLADQEETLCHRVGRNDVLFADCIGSRRDFHVDPYGHMTFCSFIKDPALRYDLRNGMFQEAWETFIPSLVNRVRGGSEFLENCAVCNLRNDCRWCDVYGYLEHGRHGAKVDYLCQMARENMTFKENWKLNHRRYYEIAGITLQVEADLPITDRTFSEKFRQFEVQEAGCDTISIRHHFDLPNLDKTDLGQIVRHEIPWRIYRKGDSWIYLGTAPGDSFNPVAVFNRDHTRARIYHKDNSQFSQGNLQSLSLLGTDQIVLTRVLADRQGCIFHSSGAVLDGQGLLFVGHSGAGKSTTVKMFQGKGEILCDDRNIVRRWPEGFRMHGTWSHGEVPLISAASAPLSAIFFPHKSTDNNLKLLENRKEIIGYLLSCLIKSLVSPSWWDKMLALIGVLAREIPCYAMEFDMSGKIVAELEKLVRQRRSID